LTFPKLLCKFLAGELEMSFWDELGLTAIGVAAVLAVTVGIFTTYAPFGMVDDIDAQRSMAIAAWAMVIVTTIGLWIGFYTLWLLKKNLVEAELIRGEAKRSARAAEASVKAALGTTKVTRRIGQAQVRAYVAITEVHYFRGTSNSRVEVGLSNSGQSPARIVNITVYATLEYKPIGGEWAEVATATSKRAIPSLAATSNATSHLVELDSQLPTLPFLETLEPDGGSARVTARVLVRYRDVFKGRRRESTTFETHYWRNDRKDWNERKAMDRKWISRSKVEFSSEIALDEPSAL
jgi:hypothetical protein